MDRAKAQRAIADLEKKLTALQDQLMNNSKEFATTRDAQLSLRNEIDTYRALLDEEARKCDIKQFFVDAVFHALLFDKTCICLPPTWSREK